MTDDILKRLDAAIQQMLPPAVNRTLCAAHAEIRRLRAHNERMAETLTRQADEIVRLQAELSRSRY